MKKFKKKSLLLALIAVFSLGFVVNVNADVPTAATCKDGIIYTNIYYFLDANVCRDTDNDCTGEDPFYTTNYTTQGYYAPNVLGGISASVLDENLRSQSELNTSMKRIEIVSGSTDTGLEKMSINTFYTNFLASDRTDNNKHIRHEVNHTWQRVRSSGVPTEELSNYTQLQDKSVAQLVNASIKTTDASVISYVGYNLNNNGKFTLQINRLYSSGITKYAGNSFQPVSATTDNSSTAKNWYLNPAAYYIQYCVKGTGSQSNPDTPTDTNPGTTSKVLRYDANGGEGAPSEQVFNDSTIVNKNTLPTRTGYTFLGWALTKDGDVKYKPGDTYTGDSATLYAIWQKGFKVIYYANGGNDAPAEQTSGDGACIKLSETKPTQTNMNFLGWSTNKDAVEANKDYAPGTEYCGKNGNLELYAVWQSKTGIGTHIAAFAVTAVIAGAALVIAKKKDLFRQI